MKRAYILVEGPSDAAFLRRVLPDEALKDTEIVTAGGNAGIPSLARSLLARRKRPIAVVMDSDSVEPDAIREGQQSMEELIRAADSSVPVKVVSAVPEIEAWLFIIPKTLEKIFGQKLSSEWLDLGERAPRHALQQLAQNHQQTWNMAEAVKLLEPEDIEQIRTLPQIVELNSFLQAAQKDERAA